MRTQPRVLVVDDDPILLRAMAHSLRQGGFEVGEASSAAECLSRVEREPPEIVLMDVVLPDGTGDEVCRRIKQGPSSVGVFVVLITSLRTTPESGIAGLEAGADAYIVRPIGSRELVARLQALARLQQTQEALRRAGEELERRVEARTAELTAANERLRTEVEQRRQLEARFLQAQRLEASGRLAAGLAHDFNNLLTIVRCNVALLRRDSRIPADLDAIVADIAMAAERGAGLTRQLLLFSRQQVMRPSLVDLNVTLRRLERMMAVAVGEEVSLQLRLAPGLPPVTADPGMVEQVILNLAVNARDAMPHGGRLGFQTEVIELEAPRPTESGGAGESCFVCLSVSDTGCGMDAATQERIFDAFFTTKEPGKGSGLGLSTVHGIVQQHQGWIDVNSAPGEGSTFRVHFPVARDAPPELAVASVPRVPRPATECILLVEDEPDVRLVTQNILQREGYRVVVAASGVIALELWRARRSEIDLLLTDVVMPEGVSGWDLAAEIQRDRPEVPVVLASGYSADPTRRHPVLPASYRFLQKPFDPQDLLDVIRASLDARTNQVATGDSAGRLTEEGPPSAEVTP